MKNNPTAIVKDAEWRAARAACAVDGAQAVYAATPGVFLIAPFVALSTSASVVVRFASDLRLANERGEDLRFYRAALEIAYEHHKAARARWHKAVCRVNARAEASWRAC